MTHFEPTWESLAQHQVPDWFHNAKLGVLIVWGLFSVPGWAPLTGDFDEVVKNQGWEGFFRESPYAEWYYNTIKFPDSSSRQYHNATYGDSFEYDDFVPIFNEAAKKLEPEAWADFLKSVGIRYVVFLTKHHDGFLLWPSDHVNPHKPGYRVHRDVTGELTAAVRARGMHMGLYYSSGLDWSYNDAWIRDYIGVFQAVPQTDDYVACVDAHWRELIDRYEPSVLWSDIAHPASSNLPDLFAYYYNKIPDGVINDRFKQELPMEEPGNLDIMGSPTGRHYDFNTPEYTSFPEIMDNKWESNRGLAHSYSFNRIEKPENYLSDEELIHMLADVVSKNGNLLLSLGPEADGTIPELQRLRYEALGRWLAVNGESIFDTRPWTRAEGVTGDGVPVRFTQKENELFAIILGPISPPHVVIHDLTLPDHARVEVLGSQQPVNWQQVGTSVRVDFLEAVATSPAHVVKFIS
ncbi:MAG: alpha-L-fucosidase [Caldilineales bacterium]|nr:alpha-L-fucosidase [Caldilineales bacterium]